MTPKPEARIIPSQDEFDSWCEHPVSRFVAAAYAMAAQKQRTAWEQYFDKPLVPADISALRLELKTREDAYAAFLETTLADYIAIVDPEAHDARPTRLRRSTIPPKPTGTAGRSRF